MGSYGACIGGYSVPPILTHKSTCCDHTGQLCVHSWYSCRRLELPCMLAAAAASKIPLRRHPSWQVLAAAAAAGCCCWLLHSSSQQQQQQPAAKQQPAASSSQHGHGCCMAAAWACCMGMAAAWACCCFKTGMHGAWHAAASKPGCMVHGKLLL